MKNLSSLKKFNIVRRAKFPRLGESPETDWEIIFLSSIVITTVVIGLCVWRFASVNRVDVYSAVKSTDQETPFNLEALKKAANYYEEKSQNFESIKNASSTIVVDPSL